MQKAPYRYRNLKLRMLANPSSVLELDPLLTINSITESPAFRYNGKDANASTFPPWGYGETLALQAGTAPTYNDGSPCLGPDDDSVKFNGAAYRASNNTLGNVGTDDLVISGLVEATGTTSVILAKRSGGVGYEVGIDAADRLYITIEDAGGAVTTVSAALDAHTWYGYEIFARRLGSCQIYIDGVTSGAAVDISARNLTLDSATALTIGADSGLASPYDSRVAYTDMWHGAAWLDTHLQGDVAAERFALLSGFLPQKAVGTSLATVKTRAFSAYLRKQQGSVIKLEKVGSEWLRMESLNSKSGVNRKGYLAEPQITNKLDKSEDFAGWGRFDAGDVVTNDVAVCPDGRTAAASLVARNTNVQHGVIDTHMLTAVTHMFSVFAEPGDKDWIRLLMPDIPNCWCFFNVVTGAVGTSGASAVGYTEGPYYGGVLGNYYRCGIVFAGIAGNCGHSIYSAEADNDDTFAGDSVTVNTYLWGAQCEANDKASSPILTAGATATRLKDHLRFKGDDGNITNNQRGTIVMDVLYPDYDNTVNKYLIVLSDGGSGADYVRIYCVSDEQAYGITRATAGNNGDVFAVGDVFDGDKHEIRLRWENNNLIVSRDGVDGTPDTDCGMPNDIDRIDIGQSLAGTYQAQCLISNIRVYSEPTRRG